MKNRCVSRSLLSVMFTLLFSTAHAQSHGPGQQIRTIGAAEFQGTLPPGSVIDSDGYLYHHDYSVSLAPLGLPEGALIERICLYANDSDPSSDVIIWVIAVKLVPGGESQYMFVIGASLSSTGNSGYGSACSKASESLPGKIDVDGDGVPDAVAYYLYAFVPPSPNQLGLGGAEITWRRQVSEGPTAPTFGDVPASDPAFPYVEALAASGITAGCAGGNYCPDATLTRRQMAVFLSKALGLHWAP